MMGANESVQFDPSAQPAEDTAVQADLIPEVVGNEPVPSDGPRVEPICRTDDNDVRRNDGESCQGNEDRNDGVRDNDAARIDHCALYVGRSPKPADQSACTQVALVAYYSELRGNTRKYLVVQEAGTTDDSPWQLIQRKRDPSALEDNVVRALEHHQALLDPDIYRHLGRRIYDTVQWAFDPATGTACLCVESHILFSTGQFRWLPVDQLDEVRNDGIPCRDLLRAIDQRL